MNMTSTGDTSNYLVNGEWILDGLLVERNLVYYSCCPDHP